jgi:hypothetical protein
LLFLDTPLAEKTYRNPDRSLTKIYLGFCVASLIALFAGKDWSIEQRLYPEGTLGISIIFTLLSLRKPRLKEADVV